MSTEALLGSAAKRIYAAAVAQGRTQEQVPSLAELAPLAEMGMHLTNEQQAEIKNTYTTLHYIFGASVQAIELLVLTLAMELDERVYLAIVNLTASGIGSPGPRVGGVLSLFYPDLAQRSIAQQALFEDAPLLSFKLVRLLSTTKNAPLSQRELCAEPSVLPHILKGFDFPTLPPQLAGVGQLFGPADLDPLDGQLEDELAHRIEMLLAAQGTVRALHMHMSNTRNAPSVSRRIAARLNKPVVLLDIRAIAEDHDDKITVALRDARMRNGLAFFINPMSLSDEEYSSQVVRQYAQQWRRVLAHEPKLVLFGSEEPETRDVDLLPSVGLDVSVYKFKTTNLQQRRELFEIGLAGITSNQPGGVPQLTIAPDVSYDYLASVYRVDETEVKAILSQAASEARVRSVIQHVPPSIDIADLRQAAREKTHRDVGKFARLVESKYQWDDLVLPVDVRTMLNDIRNSAKKRAHVYEDWGFAAKHARGLSLCCVFSGESGTGKTMSAEVIANDLGVNMYQIDISAVISKWIGETERHLGQIFDATENSDSILFFDEADAIFGKRTEVNESKDRYANIEVSYLLQRIEQYTGIVILSTNLRSNMDEAFLRRLQFGISFPMPDYEGRFELWKRAFPPQVPMNGVDYDYLAGTYEEVSGGQIKIIAIGAAMLAAGEGSKVTMPIIHRAYINELIKMQRVVQEGVPPPARRKPTPPLPPSQMQKLLMRAD